MSAQMSSVVVVPITYQLTAPEWMEDNQNNSNTSSNDYKPAPTLKETCRTLVKEILPGVRD